MCVGYWDAVVRIRTERSRLRRVRTWTIRLVFPRPLDGTYNEHQRVVREELETTLRSITVTELKWYFGHRPKRANAAIDTLMRGFLAKGAEVSPRFEAPYRRWLKHGDRIFDELTSSVLADALASGAGQVESVVLPHSYRHLAPVARPTRTVTESVEKAEERA